MKRMSLMQRTVAVLATGVMLAGLSGCGSTPAATGSVVQIKIWTVKTGVGLAALQALVAEFNKTHPGIHATAQFVTASNTMLPKITTALATNTEPNVLFGGTPSWGPFMMKSGKVVMLSTKTVPYLSEIYPRTLSSAVYKGKTFGVPFGEGDYSLFYNKTDFQKAGITKPPTTWAQVIADAVKLTNPAKHQYGIYIPFGKSEWTSWTFEGMLWSAGGHFLNANKTRAAFNSPAGIKALQTWVNILYKYHAAPLTSFATPGQASGSPAFASNVVAMVMDGPWDLQAYNKAHVNYGVTLFPKITQYATNEGIGVNYVFTGTPAQVKASETFVNWFMAPPNLAHFYYLAVDTMPATNAVNNQPYFKKWEAKYPEMVPFIKNIKYAHSRPTLVSYPAISAALGLQIDKALLHQISVKQALDTAAQQANAILAQNHE